MFFYLYIRQDSFIHNYDLFLRVLYLKNLINIICSHLGIAEILLKLAVKLRTLSFFAWIPSHIGIQSSLK